MKKIDYNKLKKTARETRWEFFLSGKPIKKTGRRKPRSEEKTELLLRMASDRLKKYPPYRKNDKLIFPYFKR